MTRKSCAIVVGSAYQNNKLFDLTDQVLNRDNCLAPFVALRQAFESLGYAVATSDLLLPETASAILYLDASQKLPPTRHKSKSFLLIQESEVIVPRNWSARTHARFHSVFTWHSRLSSHPPYVKYYWPQLLSDAWANQMSERTQSFLVGLIAANKVATHPLELYTARLDVIRWFERNHPEDFRFYGMGWERPLLFLRVPLIGNTSFARRLERLVWRSPVGKHLKSNHPCYLGPTKDKRAAYQQFKFAICYENAQNIPGYITEKLFDCFSAGVVPVYWGAPDIADYVPPECFIDRRDFSSNSDLYKALKEMPSEEYQNRLNAILEFLRSERISKFSAQAFANTVTHHIDVGIGTGNV